MYSLEFLVTEKDVLKAQKIIQKDRNSRGALRVLRIIRNALLVLIAIMLLVLVAFLARYDSLMATLFFAAIGFLIQHYILSFFIIFFALLLITIKILTPILWKMSFRKTFPDHYKNGVKYEAFIEENSLRFVTPLSEATIKWGSPLSIIESESYVLIEVSHGRYLIINRHEVVGDLDSFIVQLKNKIH